MTTTPISQKLSTQTSAGFLLWKKLFDGDGYIDCINDTLISIAEKNPEEHSDLLIYPQKCYLGKSKINKSLANSWKLRYNTHHKIKTIKDLGLLPIILSTDVDIKTEVLTEIASKIINRYKEWLFTHSLYRFLY